MEKKNIDWGSTGFGYIPTDYRFMLLNSKDGKWDEGELTTDPNVVLNECACVFQYAQTVFEGMKAYTTEDGHIVTFRPDLNAERLANSAKRLEMPVFPEDRFVDAVVKDHQGKRSLCTTIWIRSYPVCTSVYVWKQPCNRRKTYRRISVPYPAPHR